MYEIRYRKVKVKKRTLLVPTNVSRVDIKHKSTHGWQVRFRSEPKRNAWFNDSDYQGRPELSLAAAEQYMRQVRPLYQAQIKEQGIKVHVELEVHRHYHTWWLRVHNVKRGASSRRFYVGTDESGPSRFDAAWAKAVAYRRNLEQQHRQQVKAIQEQQ